MSEEFTKAQHQIIGFHLSEIHQEASSISLFVQIACHDNQQLYRIAEPLLSGSIDNPIYNTRSWLDDIFCSETPPGEPIDEVYYNYKPGPHCSSRPNRVAAYEKLQGQLRLQKIAFSSWKKPGLPLNQLQFIFADLRRIYERLAAVGNFVTQAYPEAREMCLLALNALDQLIRAVQEEIINKAILNHSDKLSATLSTSMRKPDKEKILCFSGGVA